LTTIASALHPTPAVCGYPQKYAKEYILKNEAYSREFYTGFLGPVSATDKSATLMVNLRCMKIEANTARLFVGGGITIVSDPEAEWQETQNKMQTMLQVLKPML
jgi:isochorismate synthase